MAVLPDNKKPQPQRKGTGFTNLARVMQASQGSKLGQTIAGGITGQAQQVQSGIKTAQDEFQKEAQNKRVDTEVNKEKVTSAIGNIINPTTTSSGPTSEDVDLFKTIKAAEYKGPTELANQQQLQAQAKQAQTLGSLASGVGQRSGTDQGGRQELLRRFAGGADYTSGQRKLDESILSKDKESNLASAARQTRGVAEEAQRAAAGAQAKGLEYGSLAKIFKKETEDKLTAARNPISDQLDKLVGAAVDKEAIPADFYKELTKQMQIADTLNKTPKEKSELLTSLLSQAKEKMFISGQDFENLTSSRDMTKTQPYIEAANKVTSLNSTLNNLRKKRNDMGMGGYSDAGRAISNQIVLAEQQLEQANNDLSSARVPISSGLLERAILAGIDPSSMIKSGINLDPSLNLTRSGMADDATVAKLNALDQLMQKTGTDLEFLPERQKYQEGKLDIKSRPFQKEILTKEKEKSDSEFQNAQNLYNSLKWAETAPYSYDEKRRFADAKIAFKAATARRDKLGSALKDIENQENIEAAAQIK